MKAKFIDTRDDSVIEEVEMTDCDTIEQAINTRYGSEAPEWLKCVDANAPAPKSFVEKVMEKIGGSNE